MEENLNTLPDYQDEELVIDWMGIATKILTHWKQIILIGIIFGCLGVGSTFLMKRTYSVTMTLAPETQGQSSSLGSITSMLGLGGGAVTGGADAMNITLFPEICQSTPFLVSLLDVPLTSYVSEQDREAGVQPIHTTVYKHLKGEDKPDYKPGKDEKPYTGVANPTELTPLQAAVVKALSQCVSASIDNKTGMTYISATMDDRLMAKQLADTVCRRLQLVVSEYRTKKATDDFNYYVTLADEAHAELVRAQAAYAAAVDHDRNVVLQSASARRERLQQEATLANQLYSQMAQQRELARAKIQEVKPVFAVVQPAVLPQKANQSRSKRVLIWAFAGGLLAVVWYGFLADFLKQFRSDMKERIDEEQ